MECYRTTKQYSETLSSASTALISKQEEEDQILKDWQDFPGGERYAQGFESLAFLRISEVLGSTSIGFNKVISIFNRHTFWHRGPKSKRKRPASKSRLSEF